jgi:hypothetical protein
MRGCARAVARSASPPAQGVRASELPVLRMQTSRYSCDRGLGFCLVV